MKPTKGQPRNTRIQLQLSDQSVSLYKGSEFSHAWEEITQNCDFFRDVKLMVVLEAVYNQGKKDGSRSVFEAVDGLKDQILHRNPGAPPKRKKPKSQKSLNRAEKA